MNECLLLRVALFVAVVVHLNVAPTAHKLSFYMCVFPLWKI